MKRYFEKISYEQYSKDVSEDRKYYDNINMPVRKTNYSAGYDFYLYKDIDIKAGEIVKIPTLMKVSMYNDEFLGMYIRSSYGFKYNIRMCNQVGILDADYYNNRDNEGHIWIKIQNHGNSNVLLKQGDTFVQGIFQKYLLSENEISENKIRSGGLGSTTTKKESDNNER